MRRRIAHIDLDSFFVSVERLKNPALIGKPVVVGGSGLRGVVCSASYEARKFGVTSAMPGRKAAKLCPQAIFVWSHPAEYQRYSRLVTNIIVQKIPLVEKASIDEFYLDLTGMDKHFEPFSYLLDLKKTIVDQVGLPISFALASNKLISKIATNEVKPNGQIEVPQGFEASYLAPLAVSKIPGCGQKMVEFLHSKNIYQIRDLVNTGEKQLEVWLGKWGNELYRKSLGIDTGLVNTTYEQKSLSREETFAVDINDPALIYRELASLAERVGFDLRQEGKLAACITLKIRYHDFETHTWQQMIDASDNDWVFIKKVKDLFDKHWKPEQKVRLLGVKLSQLTDVVLQTDLFYNMEGMRKLNKTMDAIKNEFGKKIISRAGSIGGRFHKNDYKEADSNWIGKPDRKVD